MQPSFILDPSQQAVVDAAADERLFVTAAAGQGKTEVLVSRVMSLVEEDQLNPADDILILSFSRAAVEAVKKRAGRHDLDGLQVRTFDSFAAQILFDEEDGSGLFSGTGFDERIRRATTHIVKDEPPQRVSQLRHVLVDEAQDLVGDRAEMVLAIFDALDVETGFTVLGDSLQGIYDFQLDESQSQLTSADFINELQDHFKATPCRLTEHYRATTQRTKDLIHIGEEIRALGPMDEETSRTAHELLDDFRRESSSTSILLETGLLEPGIGETTAVLCSTNYEVLKVSALLWKNGFPHVVRRRSQEMSIAPWVSALFNDLENRSYTSEEIKARLSTLPDTNVDDLWLALKSAEGNFAAYHSLDITQLSHRLRSRSIPLPLTVSDPASLTVSTVHRAKGLEFNNVIYLPPASGMPASELNESTAKQKYVALTRAREEVVSTALPKGTLEYAASVGRRWQERRFGKYGKYTARMEFTNSDIDDLIPYFPASESAALQVQEALAGGGLLGASVSGRLSETEIGSAETPRYVLSTDDGQIIGRTSQAFAFSFKRSFANSRSWKWPRGFEGARIISIETATGHPSETVASGLGASGMWLVPRLTGLIRPLWK